LSIAGAFVAAIACFGAAGALYAGQRVVEDRNIAPTIINPATNTTAPLAPVGSTGTETDEAAAETTTPPTFPPAEPGAKNFLITGADNNSCVDPESPYAPAFGDRSNIGERSDTIMMWRVNPDTSQVAVLSFPRDLWVTIAGRSSQQRINVAYERDNPQLLIDTIYQNFGIPTDHFIQVDFCAFQELVDAVDGVTVPFQTPVRDPNTGLNVPEAGCYTLDGDHALAYVRSRKMQSYTDEDGWVTDGTSDLGRISRQQDFLRRTVDRLLEKGAFDPDVAGALIETVSEYIVTDGPLTPRKMLEFAGVMSQVDPAEITTYQIEARNATIQGNSVLVPTLDGDNMMAILAVFRGWATLGEAPDQVFATTTAPIESTTTSEAPGPTTTRPGSSSQSSPTVTTGAPETTTTLPTVVAEENVIGVAPDPNATCE
jgi:LCP family protein required for cell wall assembly